MWMLKKAWSFLSANVFPSLLAVLGIFALFQKVRADRAVEQVDDLKAEVEVLEIKEDANEVRRRPVPDDKRVILDRM
jgi:hypothetical protein